MASLIISTGTVDGNEKDKVDSVTGRVEGLMKNDKDKELAKFADDTFKLEGAGKLADTLADADKGVVKG
ncbi:hypothetical protein Hanom_Chr05g00414041 [Helianthus anomalus]